MGQAAHFRTRGVKTDQNQRPAPGRCRSLEVLPHRSCTPKPGEWKLVTSAKSDVSGAEPVPTSNTI
jgi:hypothetical protein